MHEKKGPISYRPGNRFSLLPSHPHFRIDNQDNVNIQPDNYKMSTADSVETNTPNNVQILFPHQKTNLVNKGSKRFLEEGKYQKKVIDFENEITKEEEAQMDCQRPATSATVGGGCTIIEKPKKYRNSSNKRKV